MVQMSFDWRQSGPLLSRTRRRIAARGYAEDVEKAAAEEAKERVDARLARVIRNPSSPPVYQSKIRVGQVRGRWTVHDGGRIPYGPWLEGTGSRNYPVTIFPGYFTFRTVASRMERRMVPIANRVWRQSGRRRFE